SRLPGRVECYTESERLRHHLGDFPLDEFWEYCCNCDKAWRSNSLANLHPDHCPRCQYRIDARYLCDQCGVFTLDSAKAVSYRTYALEPGKAPVRRRQGEPDEISCPGCSNPPLAAVYPHHCETGILFS